MGRVLRVRPQVCAFALIAAVSILAYGPALFLPPIADDYQQVGLARQFGPVSAWPELARDALYRCRVTAPVDLLDGSAVRVLTHRAGHNEPDPAHREQCAYGSPALALRS